MAKHALIAGKFYPPHVGHQGMIQEAFEHAERVTIFVVYTADQAPSGPIRVEWMKELFPKANVIAVPDILTDDEDPESSKIWAWYTHELLGWGDPPDLVVCSEPYGERWAEELSKLYREPVGVMVYDAKRTAYPISATEIRENPMQNWGFMTAPTRRLYAKKVLVLGAESTGKSTLTKRLAQHYGTSMAAEYGRFFSESAGETREEMSVFDERLIFAHILTEQPKLEEAALAQAHKVYFCDTDLFTTYLWYERWQKDHMGDGLHMAIRQKAAELQGTYDLILLQSADTPFVDDGYREFDVQAERDEFTECLRYRYKHDNLVILTGSWEDREKQAILAVDRLLDKS